MLWFKSAPSSVFISLITGDCNSPQMNFVSSEHKHLHNAGTHCLLQLLFTTFTLRHMTDSLSQIPLPRLRRTRFLTLVNRRQKGVFASSQNKTKQNKSKRAQRNEDLDRRDGGKFLKSGRRSEAVGRRTKSRAFAGVFHGL